MANERKFRLPEPVSVEQALRPADASFNVPDGKSVTAGPLDLHSEHFRVAHIRSFADLGALGLMPKALAEEEVVTALHADAKAFRAHSKRGCRCSSSEEQTGAVRRQFQDHLIELLQPHVRRPLEVDDPAVLHTYHHARAWLSRPSSYLFGLFSVGDINIGKRATLTMTASVHGIYARNINMKEDSRLRLNGGGVHVRCETLNGPNPYSGIFNERFLPGLTRDIGRHA